MHDVITPNEWCASETLTLSDMSIYEIDYGVSSFNGPNHEIRRIYRRACKINFHPSGLTLTLKPPSFDNSYPELTGILHFANNSYKVPQTNNLIALNYENEVEYVYFKNTSKNLISHSIRGQK